MPHSLLHSFYSTQDEDTFGLIYAQPIKLSGHKLFLKMILG